MALGELKNRSFTGNRRSGGGGGARSNQILPAKQNIVGRVVGYEGIGKRNEGQDLANNVVVIALEHEVPTWGIDAIERDPEGNSLTNVKVCLPVKNGEGDETKGWDVHTLRWGSSVNGNMPPNPAGSIIAFEDCYFLKEGKNNKFTNQPVGAGGVVIASFISPLARPDQLNGDAANEVDPSRYALPNQMIMTMEANVDERDATRSSQNTIVNLQSLGSVVVENEADFVQALSDTIALADSYSSLVSVGVMAVVRRDLSSYPEADRLHYAGLDDSDMAFPFFTHRVRSKVDAQHGGFLVSCSPEGMEAARAAAPGATVEEVDEARILQAIGAKDWQKNILAAEGASAPVKHYLVKADPAQISGMVAAAHRDMKVHVGPAFETRKRGGADVQLGVPNTDGARALAARYRGVSGEDKPFVEFCKSNGYTVELVPMAQFRHLPSVTGGNPANKRKFDGGRAFTFYEKVGADFDGPGVIDLPDGSRAAKTGRGFALGNVGLQDVNGGLTWQGRYQKTVSDRPGTETVGFVLPSEIVTANTPQEYVQVYTARQAERMELQNTALAVNIERANARRAEKAASTAATSEQAAAPASSPAPGV